MLRKLKYMNKNIEFVTDARFLGVIVDDKLNWTHHIKTVVSKMSHYVDILYRLKSSLPLEARKLIYHSLIVTFKFLFTSLGICS